MTSRRCAGCRPLPRSDRGLRATSFVPQGARVREEARAGPPGAGENPGRRIAGNRRAIARLPALRRIEGLEPCARASVASPPRERPDGHRFRRRAGETWRKETRQRRLQPGASRGLPSSASMRPRRGCETVSLSRGLRRDWPIPTFPSVRQMPDGIKQNWSDPLRRTVRSTLERTSSPARPAEGALGFPIKTFGSPAKDGRPPCGYIRAHQNISSEDTSSCKAEQTNSSY